MITSYSTKRMTPDEKHEALWPRAKPAYDDEMRVIARIKDAERDGRDATVLMEELEDARKVYHAAVLADEKARTVMCLCGNRNDVERRRCWNCNRKLSEAR